MTSTGRAAARPPRAPAWTAGPRPALPPGPYLVAGLGRAGRGAATALAREAGADAVVGWDSRASAAVESAAASLRELGVHVAVGGDGTALLDGPRAPRTVLKSPGVPPRAPLVAEALRRELTVVDEAELGWRLDRRPVVGVTGTNGKSTVSALVAAILERTGLRAAVAGNTAFGPALSELRDVPADVVVAELSSFQLEFSPALLPDAAVLTNLDDDHWSYHGGSAEYAAAKQRLLVRPAAAVARAAVNVDEPACRAIASAAAERGGRVVTFGRSRDALVRLASAGGSLRDGRFEIVSGTATRVLRTRLAGAHNGLNVAAALALADALEIDPDAAAAAVEAAAPVPGRLEPVDAGQPFELVVDYAHNPAGVRAVTSAVRASLSPGARLLAVFAAPAFVDRRQLLATGEALAAASDRVFVALERLSPAEPVDRPPPGLLEGLSGGAARVDFVPDRRAAIRAALAAAADGDCVLLLGRGASDAPILDEGDRPRAIDDRAEARVALRELAG